MEIFNLAFDGSCGPKNPGGTAAYGFTLAKFSEEIKSGHGVIGTGEGMTNNLAEFIGLAEGLNTFLQCLPMGSAMLQVRGDSKLVINVMNKKWRPNPESAYYPGYKEALRNLNQIRCRRIHVSFDWIPREQNTTCDKLSKIDKNMSN